MMVQFWRVFRAEVFKALRSRVFYAGPILMLVIAGAAAAYTLASGGVLDYTYIAFTTQAGYGVPVLLLVLLYSAWLVSSETHERTVRVVLTRGAGRFDFLSAKYALAFSYGLVLLVVLSAATWFAAWVHGGLGGVTFGGEVIYSAREMGRAYWLGMALALFPLAAAVAFGLLISTVLPSPAAAMTAVIMLWVGLEAMKYPVGMEWAIFWTYWPTPWLLFSNRCEALPLDILPEVRACALVSVLWSAVCGGLAWLSFRGRNL
jgi:ABC-type transport system involved in multi-copper enzyme maturation permease subunit